MKMKQKDVLRLFTESEEVPDEKTVKKHLAECYKQNKIPIRCGTKDCPTQDAEIIKGLPRVTWLGKSFALQLHHRTGYHRDNSIENLQWLCPNCHATESTTGGGNTNKKCVVDIGGYIMNNKIGGRTHIIRNIGHVRSTRNVEAKIEVKSLETILDKS